MSDKMFPIMRTHENRTPMPDFPDSIPWAAIEAHEVQAQRNHGQSLARLAERGGLSACEAVAVIENRRWEEMNQVAAMKRLNELVAPFKTDWQSRALAAEQKLDKALALVASYDRQDELIGTEFEGVDEVTEVIRLLKEERDQLKAELATVERIWGTEAQKFDAQIADLKAELQKAREAAVIYACHKKECDLHVIANPYSFKCSCGLGPILERIEKEKK